MTDRSKDDIDWTLTTWEGNRRAQMERWAAMSFDEILVAQEEMAKLTDELARQREQERENQAPEKPSGGH